MQTDPRDEVIRRQVTEILQRSAAFCSLPPERRGEVTRDTVAVAGVMAEARGAGVQEIDFPGFVADLLGGVFDAIVDASIRQMEAYADLMASVAKSVDEFAAGNVSDDEAHDWLHETWPRPPSDRFLEELAAEAARREVARRRQRLLATMVLLGIQRIVDCED